MCESSDCFGETTRMRMLVSGFAGRQFDKYQNSHVLSLILYIEDLT